MRLGGGRTQITRVLVSQGMKLFTEIDSRVQWKPLKYFGAVALQGPIQVFKKIILAAMCRTDWNVERGKLVKPILPLISSALESA